MSLKSQVPSRKSHDSPVVVPGTGYQVLPGSEQPKLTGPLQFIDLLECAELFELVDGAHPEVFEEGP